MAYEWGRFIWWLGQNSAAVQALASIVAVGVSAYLAYITRRYVVLTKQLAESSFDAIRANFLPDLDVIIRKGYKDGHSIEVGVKNVGVHPLRILNARLSGPVHRILPPPHTQGFYDMVNPIQIAPVDLDWLKDVCLRPNDSQARIVPISLASDPGEDKWSPALEASLECSDLTGRVSFSVLARMNVVSASTHIEVKSVNGASASDIKSRGLVNFRPLPWRKPKK